MRKVFLACRIVLAANHHYPGNIQRLFCLQKCLSRKSSISRKCSKSFSPAELSQLEIIIIPEIFKDFFACRNVLAANHQYPGNIQRRFRLQNCRVSKPSLSRKYSRTFWPEELSQLQIIKILKILKDIFACIIVLATNHQYPENTQRFFACRTVLAGSHRFLSWKSPVSRNIQRFFGRQNCLSLKSSKSRKHSKTFSPAELSQQQIIDIPEIFKDFSRLQNCLSCKSSISRKYSKTFLPAEMSQPQIINIPEASKDVFACRIVASANHQYPAKIQRRFGLQNCLSCKSSISRKKLKVFFACIIVLAASHQYPGKIQRLFRLQNCLSRKSSLSRKYPKTFSLAELFQPQIINIPKMLKVFFACRVVLAANHQNLGNIQRTFGLLNCLSPMSSVYRIQSKTSSPAELSQQQIIKIPEMLKVFLACRIVLAASHQYPGNIQSRFRLQNCLSRKSSISRKDSKTFWPTELSQLQIINIPKKTQSLFRLHNFLSRKSSISRKISKAFSPAELSQPQIINIPKVLRDLLAC